MKKSFLTSTLFLVSILLISSCSTPESSDAPVESVLDEVIETVKDNKDIPENDIEIVETPAKWYLIEGTMGLYTSSIVMELNILNGEVRGRYFYAKHQKYLTLNGTIDKSGEVQLKESYKGEITGYLNFNLSDKIKGTWKAKADSEDFQKIEGSQITSISKDDTIQNSRLMICSHH